MNHLGAQIVQPPSLSALELAAYRPGGDRGAGGADQARTSAGRLGAAAQRRGTARRLRLLAPFLQPPPANPAPRMAPPTGPYAAVPGGSNDHFRLDSTDELDARDGNNSEAIDETERGRRSTDRARRADDGAEEDEEVDEDEVGLLGREVREMETLEEEGAKATDGRSWYQKVGHYPPTRSGANRPTLESSALACSEWTVISAVPPEG